MKIRQKNYLELFILKYNATIGLPNLIILKCFRLGVLIKQKEINNEQPRPMEQSLQDRPKTHQES